MPRRDADTEAARRLWDELSTLFVENDGSLPEVRIVSLSVSSADTIFRELLRRAAPLTPEQTVWHETLERDIPVSEVPDAGRLAAEGEISTLHVVLRGIETARGKVPALGVSVWPGEVTLDYRSGGDWNPETLAGFVDLLGDLLAVHREASLDLEDYVPAELRERFRSEVNRFLQRTN